MWTILKTSHYLATIKQHPVHVDGRRHRILVSKVKLASISLIMNMITVFDTETSG